MAERSNCVSLAVGAIERGIGKVAVQTWTCRSETPYPSNALRGAMAQFPMIHADLVTPSRKGAPEPQISPNFPSSSIVRAWARQKRHAHGRP